MSKATLGTAVIVGALVLMVFVLASPDHEHLVQAERPAPATQPVVAPLKTAIIKPINAKVITSPVMHPAPVCPAPDRSFNPLYGKAAHRHAPGDAQKFGCVVHSVAERESRQDPKAESPVGAKGMMQITDPTADELGVDPWVPEQAVDGSARYLVWLEERFPHVAPEDRLRFGLASYNWGVGNVRRTGCTTWSCLEPTLPRETRRYVAGVLRMMETGRWS